MTVTALKQSSPTRCIAVMDDGSEIKTTLNTVTDLRLYAGKELDEAAFEELKRSSLKALARERALEILNRRPYSSQELYRKLLEKGEEEEIAAECVRWLTDNGFLNDESYAASVARHYTSRGFGAGRVRAELQRRGISREIQDGTAESLPDVSEKIDKFLSSRLKDPEDRDEIRRVSAALYRRGFSWDEIRAGLNRYHAEVEEN